MHLTFSSNIRSPLIILDIGAHIGSHTLIYSHFLNCHVYAFEPQLLIYRLLVKNVQENNYIHGHLYPCAVGHQSMETTLSHRLYDGYNCEIEYDTHKIMNYGGIGLGQHGQTVRMMTVDELDLQQCDYMKIDVEGAEILVLLGRQKTIQSFQPLIWFECTDKTITEEMKTSLSLEEELPSVETYLSSFGYHFQWIDTHNRLAWIPSKHEGFNEWLLNTNVYF